VSISFESSGSFKNTEKWLASLINGDIYKGLEKYGQEGVDALAAATPRDDGVTANSWYYEIIKDKSSWSIVWGNSNIENGQLIAILIQHGHATGTGGYVQGRDYINPALKPVFDRILAEARKVVTSG
jgi:hypothetical protein